MDMEEKLQAFKEYRDKKSKTSKILLIIALGVALAAILIGLVTDPIVIIIGVVVGFILLMIGLGMKSQVDKRFKTEFVPAIVKEYYPNGTYNPKSGLPWNVINEPGFFERPDVFNSEDYLAAEYEGVPFVLSDYELQEKRVTTDGKGNTQTTYVTYAKGRFMIFDFKREFNKVVKIMETTSLGANLHGLKKVELESLEFCKKFKTYVSDDEIAFYVLTPQMQLKILELESKFKGSLFLAFMNGKLYVAINDSSDFLDVNCSKKKDVHDLVKLIKEQLSLPAAIIHELKLSSGKFNEGKDL